MSSSSAFVSDPLLAAGRVVVVVVAATVSSSKEGRGAGVEKSEARRAPGTNVSGVVSADRLRSRIACYARDIVSPNAYTRDHNT